MKKRQDLCLTVGHFNRLIKIENNNKPIRIVGSARNTLQTSGNTVLFFSNQSVSKFFSIANSHERFFVYVSIFEFVENWCDNPSQLYSSQLVGVTHVGARFYISWISFFTLYDVSTHVDRRHKYRIKITLFCR